MTLGQIQHYQSNCTKLEYRFLNKQQFMKTKYNSKIMVRILCIIEEPILQCSTFRLHFPLRFIAAIAQC